MAASPCPLRFLSFAHNCSTPNAGRSVPRQSLCCTEGAVRRGLPAQLGHGPNLGKAGAQPTPLTHLGIPLRHLTQLPTPFPKPLRPGAVPAPQAARGPRGRAVACGARREALRGLRGGAAASLLPLLLFLFSSSSSSSSSSEGPQVCRAPVRRRRPTGGWLLGEGGGITTAVKWPQEKSCVSLCSLRASPGSPVHVCFGLVHLRSPGEAGAGYAVPPPTSQPNYSSTYTIIQQPATTTSVVVVGGCPACRVGVLEDTFTCLGVLCAIVFFPIGILFCLALRQRRCPNCGAAFG
nr:brain protein I3 [Anser cygnoides]